MEKKSLGETTMTWEAEPDDLTCIYVHIDWCVTNTRRADNRLDNDEGMMILVRFQPCCILRLRHHHYF